mmetsp:Transcript_49694/g.111721  ORF Transcript_49694/g.111721 Transcript_49694/m.111721 type:complete len:216 (-) Transcript_49694:644-1291(-)
MRRTASRSSLKRSESAPTLAPLWEPDDDGEERDEQPPLYLHSCSGTSSLAATSAKSGPRDGVLPSPWQTLCAALLPEELPIQDRCSLREIELVDAVRASLCAGRLQLQVETGLVEQRYEMKPKPLSSGTQFKVMEGVHMQTHKNHSIKVVTLRRGSMRAGKAFDTMQAFHMICSFVDEVSDMVVPTRPELWADTSGELTPHVRRSTATQTTSASS